MQKSKILHLPTLSVKDGIITSGPTCEFDNTCDVKQNWAPSNPGESLRGELHHGVSSKAVFSNPIERVNGPNSYFG